MLIIKKFQLGCHRGRDKEPDIIHLDINSSDLPPLLVMADVARAHWRGRWNKEAKANLAALVKAGRVYVDSSRLCDQNGYGPEESKGYIPAQWSSRRNWRRKASRPHSWRGSGNAWIRLPRSTAELYRTPLTRSRAIVRIHDVLDEAATQVRGMLLLGMIQVEPAGKAVSGDVASFF
ncbi:hypothetical protein Tco_0637612 [Tanacetum coccineum]